MLLLAEMLTNMFCPPHSSGMTPYSVSLAHLCRGFASPLIALVDGDDDRHAGSLGVVDGLDGLGMTPSSAATIRMTMSVTLAPRAAWP